MTSTSAQNSEILYTSRTEPSRKVLLKCGGSVISELSEDFFISLRLLEHDHHLFFVHGGGQDIDDMLSLKNVPFTFYEGLRVTDEKVLENAELVLAGSSNRQLVSLLEEHDFTALGVNGSDSNCLTAQPINQETLGLVGQVYKVNVELLEGISHLGSIPVVTPIAAAADHTKLNINADYAAAALALGLKAEWCLFVTDVEGIKINGKVMKTLSSQQIHQAIEDGHITGGMIPKVTACLEVLENGLPSVTIVSGKKKFYDGKTLNGTTITLK